MCFLLFDFNLKLEKDFMRRKKLTIQLVGEKIYLSNV